MDNNHLPHEIYDLTLDTSNDQGTYIQPASTWKNPTGQMQTQFPTWTSGDVTSMSHQTTNQGIVDNSPLSPSQLSMMSNALYVGRPERAQLGTMNSVLQREHGPNFYADIRSHGPLTETSGHAFSQAGDFLQLQLSAGAPTSYGTTGGAASAYTGSEYAGSVAGKRDYDASMGGEPGRPHKRVAHSVSSDIGCMSTNSAAPRASAKKSQLEPPFMNAMITQAKIPKPGRPPGTGMSDLSNKNKSRPSKKRAEMERQDVKIEDAILSSKGGKRDEKSNKHRFPCDKCGKALTSDNDLVRHRVTEHNLAKEGALIWDCGYGCGRYSGLNPRKDNFKQHMKNRHHIDIYQNPQALNIYERRITSDNTKIMEYFEIEPPSIMQLLDMENPDAADDLSIDFNDEDPSSLSASSSQNKPSVEENDEQPKLVVGSMMSQMSAECPQEEQLPSACTNVAEQIPDDWAVLDGSGNMFRSGDGYLPTEEEFYIPDQDEISELEASVEAPVEPVVVPKVIRDVKVQVSSEPLEESTLDWATLEKVRKAGFSLLRKDPNGGPSILYE